MNKITPNTRFDTIQKLYPDALKIQLSSVVPITEPQAKGFLYGDGREAKCLQSKQTLKANGDYKCVFVFSVSATKDNS